jgi:SNF2 family DNA or RNA helicase
MKQHFKGWDQVACNLRELADSHLGVAPLSDWSLNDGQRASLRAIADRIPYNGIVIADEVGMGKTRIAVALARCVVRAGGRVAILVPPGLGYQWGDELRAGDVSAPDILRS